MKEELKSKMQGLIDLSLKYGADECDVILSKGESFSLSAQNGEIDKYNVSGSQVMGVRVIKDSKVGLSYTESLDKDAIELTAKFAVENAINSAPNPHEKISVKGLESINQTEFKKDTASVDEKTDFCLRLESEVKAKDSRVEVCPYNGFSESLSESYYLNNHSTFTYESDYHQSCYTSALIKEGKESGMHYHFSLGRNLKDLDLKSCVDESIEYARSWLEARPVKTGKYDIIFRTDLFKDIVNCFSSIFSGKGAMLKSNPFADKIGQRIANSKITLRDIPKYKDAFETHHCDSEGLSHRDLCLIENGEFKNFYHNSATANYFGVESTAHASRGAKSSLGVCGTIRVFEQGDTSSSDLTSGEYFEIHSEQGLYSGANQSSGDFSFAASGYICKDGKRLYPVKGVTISGNFYDLLMAVELIGDTTDSSFAKDFFSPLMRFKQVDIAGV